MYDDCFKRKCKDIIPEKSFLSSWFRKQEELKFVNVALTLFWSPLSYVVWYNFNKKKE